MVARRLIVFGGTGFVGSRVCRAALDRGWAVTAVSRRPPGSWPAHGNLTFVEADVFDPSQYKQRLNEADAVVHAIGSIMENPQYKQVLSQPLSIGGLLAVGKLAFGNSPNPLVQKNTFKALNTDTARVIAENIEPQPKIKPFVYISAQQWSRFVDPRYIQSKREAEAILSSQKQLRPVFLRPGFIYEPSKQCWPSSVRDTMAKALEAANSPYRISVETVATAAIDAIEDPSIEGVVSAEALRHLESYN